MKLSKRIVLLNCSLFFVMTLVTVLVWTVLARRSVEEAIGDQMAVQAKITAHLVKVAAPAWSPEQGRIRGATTRRMSGDNAMGQRVED